jgi:hypothetical protein
MVGALALPGYVSFSSHVPKDSSTVLQTHKGTAQVSDDQLMSLVKQIVGGADEKSDAWRALHGMPREELITRLETINQSLGHRNGHRVAIAFVFCLLGHHYENNKALIAAEMLRQPQIANPDADWELSLIHRLIARGDTRLLPELFKMLPQADGGMAQAITGYVVYHIQNQPDQFLVELKPQPSELRQAVYWTIVHDELLTKEQFDSIKQYLKSVPKTSPTFGVAHEMLVELAKLRKP